MRRNVLWLSLPSDTSPRNGFSPQQIPLRPRSVLPRDCGETCLVWAGFRAVDPLRPSGAQFDCLGDVALIRSAIPALVFWPFLPKRMAMPETAAVRTARLIDRSAVRGCRFFGVWRAMGGAQTLGDACPGVV